MRAIKKRGGFVLSVTVIAIIAAFILSSLILVFLVADVRDVKAAVRGLDEKTAVDSCGEGFLLNYGGLLESLDLSGFADDGGLSEVEYRIGGDGEFILAGSLGGEDVSSDYFAVVTYYVSASSETENLFVDGAVCAIKNSAGDVVLTVKADGGGNVVLWKYGEYDGEEVGG